jgi:Uma2 family endonuclease
MSVELLRRHVLTVEDFHRMGETGILGPDDRVELVEGELIDMAPIGAPHGGTVMKLTSVVQKALRASEIVSVQGALRLSGTTELYPDLTVLRPRADFYTRSIPEPADVLLLIEVSDTTLAYDRGRKVPLYARYGVPEVWVVDLGGEIVEACRGAGSEGYRDVRRHKRGESISPLSLPDLILAVADLLP